MVVRIFFLIRTYCLSNINISLSFLNFLCLAFFYIHISACTCISIYTYIYIYSCVQVSVSFNVNVHKRTRTPVCIRIYERICGACVWSWPAYLRLYVYVMSVAVRVSQREHVSGGETDAGWRRVAGPPAGTCRRVRWPEIESIGPFSSKIGLSGFLWPDSTKVYSQNVLEREKNGRPPHLYVPSGRLKHLGRIQNLLIMLTSCYVIFTLAVYSATLTTELPSFLQTMDLWGI